MGGMKGRTSLGLSYVILVLLSMSLCSFFVLVHSQCKRKPVVFNFGDSNSDTGGFCLANGVTFGPPTGRTFFHRPMGRLCDGRLMIDFLCKLAFLPLTLFIYSQQLNLSGTIRILNQDLLFLFGVLIDMAPITSRCVILFQTERINIISEREKSEYNYLSLDVQYSTE